MVSADCNILQEQYAALAGQLERLAHDPALLSRLQTAGEKRVREQFSVNTSARQLEELFNEANKQ